MLSGLFYIEDSSCFLPMKPNQTNVTSLIDTHAAREENEETAMAQDAERDDHGLGSSRGCVVW
jgi:hypothetical protein